MSHFWIDNQLPLEKARPLGLRRRQIKSQDVAAAIEALAVEQQNAFAVIDAGAGVGRRDQPPQHRRHPLRIDREFEHRVVGTIGLAELQLEQTIGVDGDGIGLDGRGRRDCAGDDFRLNLQAADPRLDEKLARLRQIQNADEQREQAGDVKQNDAPGQAGRALTDEIMPIIAQACATANARPGAPTASPAGRSAAGLSGSVPWSDRARSLRPGFSARAASGAARRLSPI